MPMRPFDFQLTLVGVAITLRPLAAADWDALFAVASDPLIWAVHPARDRWQEPVFRAYFAEALASGGALVAVDPASGAIIGASRFDRGRSGTGEVEIGWTFLARSHWGGATNRAIKALMIGHALTGFDRAIFLVGETNVRSRRAMAKIGGVLTERVDEPVMAGRTVRHVVYAIDRAAFAAGPLVLMEGANCGTPLERNVNGRFRPISSRSNRADSLRADVVAALPFHRVPISLRCMKLRRAAFTVGLLALFPIGARAVPPGAGTGIAIDRIVALQDGRHIALRCVGKGRLTILLEPGDGGRRAHMAKLSAALAKRYRVCDYDRRNVGRSSSAPLPRKATGLAADLFDALAAANVQGPYILFGTSMGGLLVRSYAATHAVEGFVTSNQPGTSREWARQAFAVMTPVQRAEDAAWMAGKNNERIDVNDVSRTIETAAAPTIPHIVMISTERFQCPAAGTCGATYRAFVAASRQAAVAGRRGSVRLIDGNHDLYVTHLPQVVKAIDDVAVSATSRH